MPKKFAEQNAKKIAWKFLTVTEKSPKKRMISLSYNANDHVYSKLKVLFHTYAKVQATNFINPSK